MEAAADIPAEVCAVLKSLDYDRNLWKKALHLHCKSRDADGIKRALSEMDGSNDSAVGRAFLADLFMEELREYDDDSEKDLEYIDLDARKAYIETCLKVGIDV